MQNHGPRTNIIGIIWDRLCPTSSLTLYPTVKAQAFLQLIFKPKSKPNPKPNPIPSYCWNYRNAPLCLSKNIVLFVYLVFFLLQYLESNQSLIHAGKNVTVSSLNYMYRKPLWAMEYFIFYNLFYIYAIVCFSITSILYVIIR